MLSYLQIRDYTIVQSIDLDVRKGFTCITGETGAGKSIMVGALGLLTGQRADTSTVRSGCEKAELTAEFEVSPDSRAGSWLKNADLADGNVCLLRRMISDKGRSRAWINGTAVTLQQLSELGSLLVEIHGQNEHLGLLKTSEQYRLLDGSIDTVKTHEELQSAFINWQSLVAERQALLDESPLDASDAELLKFHISELEHALDDSLNYAHIDSQHRKLARAGEIQQALQASLAAFESESGATDGLHRARGQLDAYAELDKDIASAIELLDIAIINCAEAKASVEQAAGRLQQDPEQLSELEHRLERVHDLARKHRSEPNALEAVMQKLADRLERSADREERLALLQPEIEQALALFRTAALRLSGLRTKAAGKLTREVTALMQDLGMAGGEFHISVSHDADLPPSLNGTDRLEFLVSANPGTPPGPLRKVASGGELSRISLAIKVASKRGDDHAVQVFDEVDAGIGGETAASVGALIKSLSDPPQALCVTHLAQVAVFADQQLQVVKSTEKQSTRVNTQMLAEDQRIDEIARMLGGQVSEQSRAHASELLASATVRH